MYSCIKRFKQVFGILLIGGIAVAQAANAIPKLDLQVDIDPKTQFLQATAKISGISAKSGQIFYLNKDFKVTSAKANGKKADFKFNLEGEPPPYVSIARPLTVKGAPKTVEFTYSGHIKDVVSDVNMISHDLVELAIYSAYFPFNSSDIPFFEYSLNLTLPKNLKVVTNGKLVSEKTEGTKAKYLFHSLGKPKDVLIIASPLLESKTQQLDGLKVEMFYSKKATKLVGGKIKSMGKALKVFEKRFGKTDKNGLLRFVYSPRKGWGYSRLPLFVVSEKRALKILKEPFGNERDIKGNVHELAHFWWSIADTNTNNDWINEGLAEYSAMSFATHQYGEEFRKNAIKGYIADIRKAKTKDSVVETTSKSPDRYVNWYEKSALLFYVAEMKYGKEQMNAFLSALHKKYKGTRLATTDIFFRIANDHFTKEEQVFLEEFLTSSGWSEKQLQHLGEVGQFKDLL